MAILEEVYDVLIDNLRGAIGSFGDVTFETYAGQFKLDFDPTAEGLSGIKIKPPTRVFTFTEWQRRSRARYARHELINRKTALEKIGDEPETITLEIKLIKALGVKPEEEASRIRQYIKDGHEDTLILGNEVIGQYVITELQERLQNVDCFGRVQVSVLSVTFEEVSDAVRSDSGSSLLDNLPVIWG